MKLLRILRCSFTWFQAKAVIKQLVVDTILISAYVLQKKKNNLQKYFLPRTRQMSQLRRILT